MNGSFTIFYIIGEVAGDSGQEWSRLPGFVGATHIFTAPREACDNCNQQEQQAQLVTSTSPITSLLLDYVENGSLNSMELDDVKPFLVKNLKWRAQTVSSIGAAIVMVVPELTRSIAGLREGHRSSESGSRPFLQTVRQQQDVPTSWRTWNRDVWVLPRGHRPDHRQCFVKDFETGLSNI